MAHITISVNETAEITAGFNVLMELRAITITTERDSLKLEGAEIDLVRLADKIKELAR